MVRLLKPCLEVGEYTVDVRQPGGSPLPADLDTRLMAIVLLVQRLVTVKAIGLDGGSVLDIRLDKGG